jgi:uncharacterized membrane protein (DUF373 family)
MARIVAVDAVASLDRATLLRVSRPARRLLERSACKTERRLGLERRPPDRRASAPLAGHGRAVRVVRGLTVARRDETPGMRDRIATWFTHAEDVVYVGLGILLAVGAVVLLASTAFTFGRSLLAGTLGTHIVDLLDQVLLVLIIVEVLYSVQVSFREHVLVPEPFLIIGLIAVTRRVLVLTAEIPELLEHQDAFRNAMIELALMTAAIVALVVSLALLRSRSGRPVAAER